MTRIGFAYNQKPELAANGGGGGLPSSVRSELRPEEEPPSNSDVYAEWDSADTIDAVASALSALGDVIRIEATEELPARLRSERPDIVFNIAEGLNGTNREAHVPAICEFFGIPYSGSDPYTLSLCLHKARTKDVLSVHGIPNAPYVVIEDEAALEELLREQARGKRGEVKRRPQFAVRSFTPFPLPPSRFPLFLKPVHEGSSKGITERNFVRDRDELEAQARFLLATYEQPVIAETFLPGAEFTCGVLGNGANARVLPIVGFNFDSLPKGALPIYGFEAKWVWDTPDEPLEIFDCPARIDHRLTRAIEDVVLRAYRVLGCRDWSRIDVRLDADGVPNVVEVNPLPGILPKPEDNSCLPKAARAAGMSYDELIQSALIAATERTGVALDVRDDGYRLPAA